MLGKFKKKIYDARIRFGDESYFIIDTLKEPINIEGIFPQTGEKLGTYLIRLKEVSNALELRLARKISSAEPFMIASEEFSSLLNYRVFTRLMIRAKDMTSLRCANDLTFHGISKSHFKLRDTYFKIGLEVEIVGRAPDEKDVCVYF